MLLPREPIVLEPPSAGTMLAFVRLLFATPEPDDDDPRPALIGVTWHAIASLKRAVAGHRWEAARAELALLERTLLERDAG